MTVEKIDISKVRQIHETGNSAVANRAIADGWKLSSMLVRGRGEPGDERMDYVLVWQGDDEPPPMISSSELRLEAMRKEAAKYNQ